MKTRVIVAMSWIAGAALFVAGIAFLHGVAASNDGDIVAQIGGLAANRFSNFVYVAAVYVCYVLFIPVIVILTTHLIGRRPVGSVIAGTFFCLGGGVEMIGTLASLSRWAYAIPQGAKGDAVAIGLFQTLTVQFLVLDFAGVALVYASAIIYAVMLWGTHRLTSYLLLLSIALLLVGIPLTPISPDAGTILAMSSILTYAIATVCLGYVVRRLVSTAR